MTRTLPRLHARSFGSMFLSVLTMVALLGSVAPSTLAKFAASPSLLPIAHRFEVGPPLAVSHTAELYTSAEDAVTEQVVRQAFHAVGIDLQSVRTGMAEFPVIVVTGPPDSEWLAALPEALATCFASVEQPTEPESYTLRIGTCDGAPWVVLTGRDPRGTFYAAQTLHQVLTEAASSEHHATPTVPDLYIKDGPAFGMRGIIEGFYGPPWSHQTRLDLLDFMGQYKMNTYVYAPKDDPYHRERWRDPYPPLERARLSELVQRAQRNHVDFVFAISPGLSIEYSSDAEFELLAAKTEAMWELGVRHFALLLDDISTELTHASDRERFGTDIAAAHAYLVNRYNRYLKEKGAGQLIMVPIDYYQPGPTPYRNSLREHMDSDVLVYWTGLAVVAPTITSQDAERITAVYDKELLVWDNYPVNDFNRTRLYMGPLQGRDSELWQHVAGLTANPMNEGQASKVPLITVASYLWNPQTYNAEQVWDMALRREGGAAYQALRRLAEVSWESILHRDAMPHMEQLLVDLWPMIERVTDATGMTSDLAWDAEALRSLREEFEAWQRLPSELTQGLANRRLYPEIGLYAEKMRRYGVAGIHALDALTALARLAQDPDAHHARGELWEAYHYLKGDMGRVTALAQQIFVPNPALFLSQVQASADVALQLGERALPYTNFTSHYGDFAPEFMTDGDPTTFFWSDRGARFGDYVGIDLGEVRVINRIDVQFNQQVGSWARPNDYPRSSMLQTSVDGLVWRNVGLIDRPSVSIALEPIEARYVRAFILVDQGEWVQVTDMKAHVVDDAAFKLVSPTAMSLLAVDSQLTSHMMVPRGSVGEVLRLTADRPVQLEAVELFTRPGSPMPGLSVEVSADGDHWTVLGHLEGAHGWWSTEALPGVVGHVRLVIDQPLSESGFVHELVLHVRD